MSKLFLCLALSAVCLCANGQRQTKSLQDYIELARQNSPLLYDNRNQIQIEQEELERLKALYRHSRMELNGDLLFVPVVSNDGGNRSFKWNAQDAIDYYGYDLGESSGHIHTGITWTQPLLGNLSYKVAQQQSRINTEIANNNIRLEEHQLERTVTEQYLLCLLDKANISFADSIESVLEYQTGIVRHLIENGLAKQSDLHLLNVERESNTEQRLSFLQSYHTHLMDLNLLCGIEDTTDVILKNIEMEMNPLFDGTESIFTEQYRLDSLNAEISLKSFNLQYRPKLDLFVDAGAQSGKYSDWHKHFGMSAGLTFSWTIFDGRQKRQMENQTRLRKNTIMAYYDNAKRQKQIKVEQCLSEIKRFYKRGDVLNKQLYEYGNVLSDYTKEIEAGQISVLDYITVLRSRMQAARDYLLVNTNRQIAIAAYNYWNN